MGPGIGKLGAAVTVVFALSLVGLLAELVYVLWRRGRFHRQTYSGAEAGVAGSLCYLPSKELLYFFCWKNQSRVEPNDASPAVINGEPQLDEEIKLPGPYGPSRVLFTIKEEEEKEEGLDQSVDPEVAVAVAVTVTVAAEVEEEATPFQTPCASPPYFTPPVSPTCKVVSGLGNPQSFLGKEQKPPGSPPSGDGAAPFIVLEINDDRSSEHLAG